jgi:hypothetical protein
MPEYSNFNFTSYSPEELSYLASTFAVAMAKGLDDDSVNILSSFFFSIGGTLGLLYKQRILIEDLQKTKP